MRRRTKSFASESGQVVVLFALLLPVFFGLGAIVLDIGNWYVHKRHLQTQVDAAALAAAPAFSSCFFDPTTANLAIASTALSYAGDTARDPDSTNLQVQEPNDVRVTLNSQRYWADGDPVTPTTTGYGSTATPVGDNSAGTPCATSTLDVKATDADVPKLFSWLGIRPDIKAHARVEIRAVKEESGFLPLAVPEIDPNYVYAIFVDYRDDGTQQVLKVQPLKKDPSYCPPPGSPCTFPYAAWVTNTDVPGPGPQNAAVTLHPDSANSDGTGVVILVSKSDVAPAWSPTSSLNAICNQTPTDLVQCYAGTGSAGYDGAASGQGLAFIHSFATNSAPPTGAQPRLRDVNLGGMVCTGPIGAGNLSGPYYVNEDSNCTVGVTAKVDFGVQTTPANGDPRKKPNQGGFCAGVGPLDWQPGSTNGTVSTWTGTLPVPEVGGPQVLTLSWQDKTSGTSCSSPNSGTFGKAAMAYATDDNSGPVGYVKLTASGPNGSTTCPAGSGVSDANSTPRGSYCYSVAVGLDQPLGLKPWDTPSIVLRFGSKAARKGGSGTANLNGSLLCDSGRTLEDSFSSGCFTTYGLNYDKWGPSITPVCSPGSKCWKDVKCAAYPPSSLPPASYVNNPPPICIAAKNGQVQAFQAGMYNRFEDPGNGYNGCSPNKWPTTQGEADQFFKADAKGNYGYTSDPRYVRLVITDNTAFSSANTAEPVKYFAGFYATGWDTGNGAGKPKGCYDYPIAGTCGNPNNDKHPLLGCLAGNVTSRDNGDMWGHFVKFVDFSSSGTASEDVCDLTSGSVETCIAVLVE